jgi:plastocyanin
MSLLPCLALLVLATACDRPRETPPARRVEPAVLAATPMSVRGAVTRVQMVFDNQGYRFAPGYVTVNAGDGVQFLMISGVPHNVAFDAAFIPKGSRNQLVANLSLLGGRDLASPVVTTVDSSFVVSTTGLPPGEYLFYCGPHQSLNMHGVITVR